jgi:hypothetical protein
VRSSFFIAHCSKDFGLHRERKRACDGGERPGWQSRYSVSEPLGQQSAEVTARR